MYVKNAIPARRIKSFGFDQVADAEKAEVGEAYRVKFIKLSDLKKFNQNSGAESIMTDTDKLWLNVSVGGKVATKIEIIEKEGRLIAGEFGGNEIPVQVDASMKNFPEYMQKNNLYGDVKKSVVQVPVLRAVFSYMKTATGEFLIPAMYNPERFGLTNGKVYNAAEVLNRLKEEAKNIDPDKVM